MKSLVAGPVFAAALVLMSAPAMAIPNLQLGIVGATYDTVTETSLANSNAFTLYTFLDKATNSTSVGDTYYLSAALVRTDGTAITEQSGLNLGSFKIGGTTYQVTSDMAFGNPPLETVLDQQPGDLPPHGVFPTYFKELSFKFDSTKRFLDLDVAGGTNNSNASLATLTSTTDTSNSVMYGKTFAVDVSNLASGYAIHFDLYHSAVKTCAQTNCIDLSIDAFAPFSHDAGSRGGGGAPCVPGTPGCGPGGGGGVSEPGSLALALIAILGVGRLGRRKPV